MILMIYQINLKNIKYLKINIIFIIIVLISVLSQNLIKNQIIIFFLLPILIGLVHSKLNLVKEKKNIFFIIFLISLNLFITAKYHERFNIDRKFMDLQNISKSSYENGSDISSKLKGLKWFTTLNSSTLNEETMLLKDTIKYLKKNNTNSVIITVYQFINSEINSKIYSPNRWYTDDGVSYPLKDSKYFDYYVNFYKKKLIEKNVTKIFTISPIDEKSFNFIFTNNCYETTKINQILLKHELVNCFAK